MKQKLIRLKDVEEVLCFTSNSNLVEGDIIVRRGKYCIDGKSSLGIAALDASAGVVVEYPEEAELFDKFLERFEI